MSKTPNSTTPSNKINKLIWLCFLLFFQLQVFGQSKVGIFDKIICKKLIGNGNELFYAGRTSEAMFTFKRAKMKNPNSWKANYHLAMSQFYLKSYISAKDNIVAALNLSKGKPWSPIKTIIFSFLDMLLILIKNFSINFKTHL